VGGGVVLECGVLSGEAIFGGGSDVGGFVVLGVYGS